MKPSLKTLEREYLQRQSDLSMKLGQRSLLQRQLMTAADARTAGEREYEHLSKTHALLLHSSGMARSAVQSRIEGLVSSALTAITGQPYGFKMDLKESAAQWSVSFKVVTPSGSELDPLDQMGGGIIDICSMALRIAILEMYEPHVDGPILLDENFKFLSREHVRTAVEWIRAFIAKSGRQIILVTHVEELADGADKVFEVEPLGDTSKILDITAVRKEYNAP